MLKLDTCDWFSVAAKIPSSVDSRPFDLDCPIAANWDEAPHKVLVVIQEVASADLKNKALCSSTYGDDLSRFLELVFEDANLYQKVMPRKYAFAVVNFQAFMTYHLQNPAQISASHAAMASRIKKIIGKLEPTHVLLMGDEVSKALKPDFNVNTRGWAENLNLGGVECAVCSTLDLSSITDRRSFTGGDSEEDDEEEEEVGGRDMFASAGLVESAIRYARNLFLLDHYPRGNPHHIEVKAKWDLLTTVEEVKAMVDELRDAPYFAYDTETANLNRIDNKLLIMQFAHPNSDRAYIVPFWHRESPFEKKEIKKIRALIYDLFMDWEVDPFGDEGFIIGTNLQFDVTQTREQLAIPVITRPLWDIQNGEYLLDENQCQLDKFAGDAPKAYSLAAIALRYGCDAFLDKEGFNKQDRDNMEFTSLDDKSFLDYCALDVLVPLAIYSQQLERARLTKYKKFSTLCLVQQSSNEHAVSNMEHRGVLLDVPYLESLLEKGSPMDTLINEASNDIMHSKGVKKANELIQAEMGLSAGSLFDDIAETDEDNAFNPSKAEHQQILFQDVLELEPVMGFQKKGRKNGKPAYKLGKAFQQAHRFVFEVSLFNRISKLKKMKSAYVEAFLGWIKGTPDGALTGRMRPSFGFIYVVTGRSNSSRPSLQQTPSRGKEAKLIKRSFIAPKGFLRLATDYSANEVRFAANIAKDKVMAHAFIVARQLRKAMHLADKKEVAIKKELKRRGIKYDE